MILKFDTTLTEGYKSSAQRVRVMSESWLGNNMYCPNCGNPKIQHMTNNSPVADFQCDNCGEIYELKSKKGNLGKKIADGAYSTMIERITSDSNPDLFLLQYSEQYDITALMLIPRFFFVPEIIEKRKPLAPTARRHDWVGCNILYHQIPDQGRIEIINNSSVINRSDVIESYKRIKQLKTKSLESRGWLLDVLNCVNDIKSDEFTLNEVYDYVELLQQKHINNNNVEAKIRQQLQFLRDKGFIEFLGRGQYRKI